MHELSALELEEVSAAGGLGLAAGLVGAAALAAGGLYLASQFGCNFSLSIGGDRLITVAMSCKK